MRILHGNLNSTTGAFNDTFNFNKLKKHLKIVIRDFIIDADF